jgi:hypothetical protein
MDSADLSLAESFFPRVLERIGQRIARPDCGDAY